MFSASIAAAAIIGGKAVEKTNERARFKSQSIKLRRPATNPPAQPSALLSVPMRM
jgi:hypothetical protein